MAAAPVNSWAAQRAALPAELRERRSTEYRRDRRSFAAGVATGGAVAVLGVAIAALALLFTSHPAVQTPNLVGPAQGSSAPTRSATPTRSPSASPSASATPSTSPSASPVHLTDPHPLGHPLRNFVPLTDPHPQPHSILYGSLDLVLSATWFSCHLPGDDSPPPTGSSIRDPSPDREDPRVSGRVRLIYCL